VLKYKKNNAFLGEVVAAKSQNNAKLTGVHMQKRQ